MPTFVYAPGIKVYIDTQKNGVVDVSDDLTQGSMVRRSDGVSSFEFGLQNRQRKYDQIFAPNDRIVVMMKRVTWVRVFTGYLNTVPLLTAWPSDVTLAASCSLKRLQYWYWDSYAPYTQQMIRNALGYGDQGQGDGGATSVLLAILDQVVGWPSNKVHVSKIPPVWLDFAYEIADSVQRESQSEAPDLSSILGNGSGTTTKGLTITQTGPIVVPGSIDPRQTEANMNAIGADTQSSLAASPDQGSLPSPVVSGTVKPGRYGGYGGYDFTADRLAAVRAIWRIGLDQRRSDKVISFAIYCAMAETNLNASYANPSGSSKGFGMFSQLRPADLAKNTDRQVTQFFIRYDRRRKNAPTGANWLALSKAVQAWGIAGQYAEKNADGTASNLPNKVYESAAYEIVRLLRLSLGTQNATGDGIFPWSNLSLIPGAKILEVADTLVGQEIPYIHSQSNMGFLSLAKKDINQLRTVGLDCSGLTYWVFEQALGYGKTPFIPKVQNGSNGIFDYCKKNGKIYKAPKDKNHRLYKIPGALFFVIDRGSSTEDHIGIALGDGTKRAVQARRSGVPAGITTDNWNYIGLVDKYVDYSGGPGTGVSTSAPAASVSSVPQNTTVPRDASSTKPYSGPIVPALKTGGSGPDNGLFGNQWYPGPIDGVGMAEAASLTGIRALMNDQPLLPYLKNLMNSTMRSYCSAPNGDFMAWFPDYYGIWGTAAKMVIQPIEVQDFQVYWSDDFFVTHQYVVAGQFNFLDVSTGSVSTQNPALVGGADIRTQTLGIATVEIPAIMKGLFNIDVGNGQEFKDYIFQRFGARPDFQAVDGIVGRRAEFFAALYMFMRQWVYQYNADIPLTFMPELYPGMLIQIPYLDFQAYVVTVTHTFQFGQGGGFDTSVNICAPAKIGGASKDSTNVFIGLPDFGGLSKPGPNSGFDLSETTPSGPSNEAMAPQGATQDPVTSVTI